jgi:VCBS repeat-containing protein
MADTTTHQLHVALPGAGNIQTYHLDGDTPVKFDFDLANAVFTGENGNLEITVEGGGTVVLENYEGLADQGHLPLFEMFNGERVAGNVYLFAFDGADQNASMETAAANATGSSGAGQYNDDPGALFAGINALGDQGGPGDTYGTHAFPTLSGTLAQSAPIAPTANDDSASVTEQDDADFAIGRHLVFVDDAAQYQEAVHISSGGEGPALSEFFPLSTGGGFYLAYPNPAQTDETIQGNVIDNDADPDTLHDQLAMYTMDFDGVNHNGVDPAAVQVAADDTVIVGKYGVLVVDTDGHWEYTLNQSWADALNEGESRDEVFHYNVTDPGGLVSNTATLTITVNGANDAPVAHDDLNVQAVETGDSTDYGLHAGVYDADLNGDTGGVVSVYDDAHHDFTQAGAVIHGNVLAGDDAGSVTDTDVDGGDSPDGRTMFVVGVYSHATETVDYVQPDEHNPDFTPSGAQDYEQAHVDPSATVAVNGEFGVLTIHADGSYDYRLYTPEDGDAYHALNALNYGSENNVDAFSYGIMDDSGAFSYANLSFTVNGANDAPVAMADANNVAEFGLGFAGDADYSAVVSGNVIAGDAHGGVADTDVDDTRMFVSTVSSQTGGSDTLYTDSNADPNGSVTINGEYGTLTIHADGSYDYTLHNEWDNVQALQEGEGKTDVFTYTLTNPYADGVYSDPAPLTIHVAGSNDAPVATADTATLTESAGLDPAATVSGNVLAGDGHGGAADTDVDNRVDDFTVTAVAGHGGSDADAAGGFDVVGQYGTLHMNADGSYTYTENPGATNYLNNDSAPVTDTFTYTMTDNADGHAGTSTATLAITINGANDAPAAMADTNTLTESVDNAAPATVDGNVLTGDAHGGTADTDVDNQVSDFTVTGVTGHGGSDADAAGGFDVVGQYGTLHMNADGSYTYTENPGATNHLNSDSDPVTDVFTYTMSDNQAGDAGESSATLTITVNGADDSAVITGDSAGAVIEDHDVFAGNLLTDSGRLFASDPDNPDNLFRADTVTDSRGGTFHIDADGTWTYEIDNGSVQHLGETDGVNSGFSNDFTVHSADGTEHVVTVSVGGENDAPLGADFSVHGGGYGDPVHIDFGQAPVSDVEDGFSAGDGLDTGVVVTGLPDHGTLYYGDHEVTQSDIDNGVRFDDLDNFTYKGDAPAGQGVLIGSRLAEDAGLDTWGERVNNSTRKLSVDTDGDGNPDVTVTTHVSEGKLTVYADQQNHIDHGLANPSHNGLDSGETLTMTFEGRDVSYADIGFGGLGGYFDHGGQQDGQATWAVYDNGRLVASGTVDNSVMTWDNAVTGQSGVITGGDGDTFQSLVLDQTILGGEHFDRIVFGTAEDAGHDWNANWELQYVDVEFAGTDTISYRPVDSEGLSGDDYTVTVSTLPGPTNEDPAAVADAASVHEPNDGGLAHSVSANVLANDVDADNTPGEMSVTKVAFGDTTVDFAAHQISGTHADWGADGTATIHGEHGDLVIGSDGDYTSPATDSTLVPGDAPTETFSYTMTDGDTVDNDPVSQTADLVITVNGLNDAPDAVDDGVSGLTGATHDVALNIANGFTADGITIVADQTTDHTIIHNTFGLGVKTGDGDNTAIDTTQGAGTEQVTFRFDDLQDHATITLADFNNTDHDDDAVITLLNADGDVVGTITAGVDQTNPTLDLTGSEPFQYVVVQPAGSSEDGFYIQSISGHATDYSSTDGAIVVAEDSSISINVLANDTDPDLPNDHLAITGLGDPAHGSVSVANGEVVYTPDANYNGADSFTYTVTDDYGATDTATVYLNVAPVNDRPSAVNDSVTVLEDHTATGNVISGAGAEHPGQDTDIDGDSLTVTRFTVQGDAATHAAGETAHIDGVGDLVINADGSYSFTPAADYDGDVPTATYTVTDGNGGYASADLTIDITPVDDNTPPMAVNDSGSGSGFISGDGGVSGTFEAAVITGNALANDHDVQDIDYTDGPGYPAGFTELTVTGAAAGNLDNLTRAEYDQHLANGDFNGDSGTFSLAGDGVGATVHGQFGDLVIAEDGSYVYTTHDGLPAGDYAESFTYQVSDTDGAVDYGVIKVEAAIDTLVAHADLGHGALVTDTLQPAYEWQSGGGHDINFTNQTEGNPNEWHALAHDMGLKVSATIDGIPAWVGEMHQGIGVDTPIFPDSPEIENLPLYREALTLDFGQDGHDLPEQLALHLNHVSTGEDVIFTITDSNDHTYTVHAGSGGNNATYTDGTGTIVLTKANNNQYYITGSHAGLDGSGELLIKSVTIGGAWFTKFSLNYISATMGGEWVENGTTGELSLPSVSGSLFGNAYSSDDAAMTAAIVGSGVGAWGTLEIAANGQWTYTPNENVHAITTGGQDQPAVEQFTYQVTDAHGLTDTASLYVPVHVNATAIHGTAGADHIAGSDSGDLIYGHGGDDIINGHGGNDFLYGGAGDDVISGGAGHDYISGGDGNDVLHGGAGNDYLFGGNGNDTLWGGAGNDVIHAGAGDDTVFVSSGHDTVTLGAGADTITVDPTYLTSGDGGGSMTVTDFNIGQGDHIDLGGLSAGVVDVSSADNSGDLVLTIADVNPAGDDITITLQGVLPPTHDTVDHQVNISAAGDDLNTVIQHIISSGGHSS